MSSGSQGRVSRVLVVATASLSLVIGAVTAYGLVIYQINNGRSVDPSFRRVKGAVAPCTTQACNYLILGSDSRTGLSAAQQSQFGTNSAIGGSARSDVIMLVHTQVGQKTTILSFPRDLWVNIPGHGQNKINASFEGGINGGGPELVAQTVHALTGLKISHYLYVDLAGFQGVLTS